MKRKYKIKDAEEFRKSIEEGLAKGVFEKVATGKYYTINGGLIIPDSFLKYSTSTLIFGTSPQHLIGSSNLLGGLEKKWG